MKKGFTLVEIIISIGLILLISTSTVLFFHVKKNNSLDELKEIVISSSSIKFLTSEEDKNVSKENYGYTVYTLDSLINDGLINEKKYNELINKLDVSDQDSYKKIIVIYDSYSMGDVEYIYPYVDNTSLILSDMDDVIFYKDSLNNKFKCDEDLEEIAYFDKNYKIVKKNISDLNSEGFKLECSIDNNSYNNAIDITDVSGNIDVLYKLTDEVGNVYNSFNGRKVEIIDFSNLNLVFFDGYGNQIKNIENWYRGPVYAYVFNGTEELSIDANLDIEWANLNQNIVKISKNKLKVNASGEIDVKAIVSYLNGTRTLEQTIKVDNEIPIIESLNIQNNEISFKVSDKHSGVKSVKIYENNKLKKTIDSNFNSSIIMDVDDYKKVKIIVVDNVGNQLIKYLNNETTVFVESVDNSIFKFNININNAKSASIVFDFPYINELNKNRTENMKHDITALQNKLNKTITLNNGSSEIVYDFNEIIDIYIEWYDNYVDKYWAISESILENLQIDLLIKVKDQSNNEKNFKYRVTLNAYENAGYFEDCFTKPNNYSCDIKGMNNNGDIIYIRNDHILYMKPNNDTAKKILSASEDIYIMQFDKDILKYGYYEYNKKKKNYNEYIYTYNIKNNKISNTKNTGISEKNITVDNDYKFNFLDNFDKITNKSYYSGINEWLSNYKKISKKNFSNYYKTFELSGSLKYYIVKENDNWFSVLMKKQRKDSSRSDYSMLFYKENVSVKKLN